MSSKVIYIVTNTCVELNEGSERIIEQFACSSEKLSEAIKGYAESFKSLSRSESTRNKITIEVISNIA